MKLIKSEAKYIPQENGLEGIYKQIELAGRTCYKSEDKITEDSAKGFVDRMIKSKHYAMLEHGTVYLAIPNTHDICLILEMNPYTKCNPVNEMCYATTNLRVLVEHNALWLIDKYLCEPTEHHEKRYTFKFITDQGVLREITRHRVFSFAVESTRYCNYSKDKFGMEVTYICPSWIENIPETFPISIKDDWGELFPEYYYKLTDLGKQEKNYRNKDLRDFKYALSVCEKIYFSLLNAGWKPQQARNVLPLATKCDMFMTGFASDWKHFFDLRMFGTTGKPHPDMELLALKASEKAIKANIINDIVSNPNNIKI